MKLVWLSNIPLVSSQMASSGTWIYSMAAGLVSSGDINIVCISCSRNRIITSYRVSERITQYIFPFDDRYAVRPSNTIIKQILERIEKEDPSIIHVWGTEQFWADLPFEKLKKKIPLLLDMQGYMQSIYDNYYGGLNIWKRLSCFGLRELILSIISPSYGKRAYKKKAVRENRMIRRVDFVSAQSRWIESILLYKYQLNNVYRTKIALRPEFYNAKEWEADKNKIIVFTTASPTQPLKGLNTLLESFNLVSKVIPNVELHIAGEDPSGFLCPGYTKMIKKYIHGHHLDGKVEFCGLLNTDDLIKELTRCSVYVNPSYVESYSLSLAEAMIIGVPCVASYVGAMPELGEDGKSVLFYPKGDYVACAGKIISLLQDKEFSKLTSNGARETALSKHRTENIVQRQLTIYEEIFEKVK